MDDEKKKERLKILDPNTYKKTRPEKFTLNSDIEDIFHGCIQGNYNTNANEEGGIRMEQEDNQQNNKAAVDEATFEIDSKIVIALVKVAPKDEDELTKAMAKLRREFKKDLSKSTMLRVLNKLITTKDARIADSLAACLTLKPVLIKKSGKSQSGVLVVTVLTSPYPIDPVTGEKQMFTCKWNCYYCPNEPGQPRSYLHDEPSVLRANRNHFDAVLQFFDRVVTLSVNGHPSDKIELLILGGTWDSYPANYREEFIRDLFFAANCYAFDMDQALKNTRRERLSLAEEKKLNEETKGCKIIGITMETRPDCITEESIRSLRQLGCTRVQLGLQHTSDEILKKINRGHSIQDAKNAIRLLKNVGYKIDVHLMPNLPGSNPDLDGEMFSRMLGDSNLQADQWKIYPTEVTPWTVIEKWYNEGSYVPYGEEDLMNVLIGCKSRMHPWIRLNRVIRDIPSQYILGGVNAPSMRQDIKTEMTRRQLICPCIRCREVGAMDFSKSQINLVERRYFASGGDEIFISAEFDTPKLKDVLIGFCRLRLPPKKEKVFFPELRNAALVRELHVYGQLEPTAAVANSGAYAKNSSTQHVGLGRKLMLHAEAIAVANGYSKMAVIAGVGSRGFYRKVGYELDDGAGEYMMKRLSVKSNEKRDLQKQRSGWKATMVEYANIVFAVCLGWSVSVIGTALVVHVYGMLMHDA